MYYLLGHCTFTSEEKSTPVSDSVLLTMLVSEQSTADPEELSPEMTPKAVAQSTPASKPDTESVRPRKAFTGVRSSKFRHLHGTPMHKSNNIENVRNLSISMPGDCDGFQVNQEFAAFPLSGPGGQIAVIPVSLFSMHC